MASLVRDFLDMATAIMRHWWALAVGILAGGVITAYDRWRGEALDLRTLLVPLALALVLAFFLAWREKNARLMAAAADAAAARDALSAVTPQLFAQILGLQWDEEQRNTQPFFMVAIVGITNRGADGGIGSFDAKAADFEAQPILAHVTHPTNSFELAQTDGGRRVYEPHHFLSDRVVVVQRNVPVIGAVLLVFPHIADADGPTTVDPSSVEIAMYDSFGALTIARPVEPAVLPTTRVFPGMPQPKYGSG
jgi:hypothetical protein